MAMITSPRNNLYESTDGFTVEVLGRTGLKYTEDSRTLFVDSEVVMGPSGMMVYKDSIQKWNEPDQDEAITDPDRDRIIENIKSVFASQGFNIDVV